MIDGSTTSRGAQVGCVLISLEGRQLKYTIVLSFPKTNDEVEYEAPIIGLLITQGMGFEWLHIKCDS